MSGTPTLVTLGVDRTVTPAALTIVNGGAVFATLGTYTTAGVWTPAGALLPGNNLSDVATPATARTNLGLGSMATQAASAVAITGGTLDGTKVGATTPATGAFTSLSCQGSALFGASTTTAGAVVYSPNGNSSYLGIYDANNKRYYGFSVALPAPTGTSVLGGYYGGLGVGGATNGTGVPVFGVLTSTQSGNGIGSTALTIYDTNRVVTYKNTLDDGAGNMVLAGGLTIGSAPAAADSSSKVPSTAFLTGYTVRVDLAQSFTAAQRAQGQANLGVAPYAYVVNPTSPYAANPGDDVWCSTASAAQTVTLPASPIAGTVIGAMRQGANALTVAANGNTIAGTAADLVIDQDKSGVWLRRDATNTTWQVEPRTRA